LPLTVAELVERVEESTRNTVLLFDLRDPKEQVRHSKPFLVELQQRNKPYSQFDTMEPCEIKVELENEGNTVPPPLFVGVSEDLSDIWSRPACLLLTVNGRADNTGDLAIVCPST
jgi:hypothetical protein